MSKSRFVLIALAAIAVHLTGFARAQPPQALQSITITYPTRSGASWPMYIAKEGGYYAKYGLDVNLVFGVHPAGIAMLISGESTMGNEGFEPAMNASMRDGSLVAVGSSLNRGLMALIARKEITTTRDLAGKRIGVGRVGDVPYHLTVSLLARNGLSARQVQWVPSGADAQGRAASLMAGTADAALLTTPAYFRLESAGFHSVANLADYPDIFVSTVYLFKKSYVAANPKIPEMVIKAHSEAIKRFYDDRAFAIQSYVKFDKQAPDDVARVYDLYAKARALERVPYVLTGAVKSAVEHADPINESQMKAFDFTKVVDNSIVRRLVSEGFFERLFGPDVKADQDRQARLAFGL